MRPVRGQEILATATAGLGSVFTAIVDKHLKPGGRLALVLSAAVTTGGAWDKTRILIDHSYDLEFVVTSHDATRWQFSESANYSDVLLVARKRLPTERRDGSKDKTCTFINLWRNPTATADALALGESIEASSPAPIGSAAHPFHGTTNLMIGTDKWGELVSIPLQELWGNLWPGSAFAHTELVRANWLLRQGKLVLPGARTAHDVQLCPLEKLGELGPDGRDIHDGFTHGTSRTSYAAFWNHDADTVVTMAQHPNEFLSPRSRPAAGRPRRPASLLWPRASHLMVAVRLRFNTHRLVAVRLSQEGLSNVWYPLKLIDSDESHERVLLLWLNSSLGLLLLAGHRVPTQGAWVQFKKPTWDPMPVLDIGKLSKRQLKQLSTGYDSVANEKLEPLPRMDTDPIREEIDDLLSHVLGLPSLAPIRALLAREPVINNEPLWKAGKPEELAEASEQFELLLPS